MERGRGLKKQGKVRVYHGSYAEVKRPLVRVGRMYLDFGQGFYVTNIEEQARRWAKRVCIIRNENTPVLNVYDLDIEGINSAGYKILRIPEYNKDWLDFIVECRRGGNIWRGYDVVEGGVANDQVIDAVEDYDSGRMTMEQALGQLRLARPTNQICIHKQEIVDCFLQFQNTIPL